MADMGESGGGHEGKGKKRAKKSSTRIDMTPMVDLGFLLLTFFVMTSTFSKPKVMSLVYPAKIEDPTPPDQPKINNAITFLLSEDKIYYYAGQYYSKGNKEGKPATELEETTFGPNGLRKLLADRNAYVIRKKEGLDEKLKKKQIQDTTYERTLIDYKKHKEALKVLVKTDDKATCKNFIDLIDELKIAQIGVIAPVDLLASELELIKAKK
ncbi:MAG: biopolymer transporter ExbD [Bacteroidota bacterium]